MHHASYLDAVAGGLSLTDRENQRLTMDQNVGMRVSPADKQTPGT
jgi:hypothetical protein